MNTLKLDLRWLRRKTGEVRDPFAGYASAKFTDVLQWRMVSLDGSVVTEWQDVRKEYEDGSKVRY